MASQSRTDVEYILLMIPHLNKSLKNGPILSARKCFKYSAICSSLLNLDVKTSADNGVLNPVPR